MLDFNEFIESFLEGINIVECSSTKLIYQVEKSRLIKTSRAIKEYLIECLENTNNINWLDFNIYINSMVLYELNIANMIVSDCRKNKYTKQYQKELSIRIRMHSDIINELKDGTISPQNFSKSEVKKYVKKDK